MVCMFSLTLLSMYKIGQLHMFATKNCGFLCLCITSRSGADPGGGAWGAHAPPFGTEQALNAEVYCALSACSYSDTAHISI